MSVIQFIDQTARVGAAVRQLMGANKNPSALRLQEAERAAAATSSPAPTLRFALGELLGAFARHVAAGASAASFARAPLLASLIREACDAPQWLSVIAGAYQRLDLIAPGVTDAQMAEMLAALQVKPRDAIALHVAVAFDASHPLAPVARRALAQVAKEYEGREADLAVVLDPPLQQALGVVACARVSGDATVGALAGIARVFGAVVTIVPATAQTGAQHTVKPGRMASVMLDVGPVCVATVDDAKALIDMFPQPTEAEIADAILVMLRPLASLVPRPSPDMWDLLKGAWDAPPTRGAGATAWAHANFAQALKEKCSALSWSTVLRSLDRPGAVLTGDRMDAVAAIFKRATGQTTLPLECFLGPWANAAAQWGALRYIMAHPDAVERRLAGNSGTLPEALVAAAGGALGEHQSLWQHLDFAAAILDCQDVEPVDTTAVVMDAAKAAPGVVIAALSACRPRRSSAAPQVVAQVLQAVGPIVALQGECYEALEAANALPILVAALADVTSTDPGCLAVLLPHLQRRHLFEALLGATVEPRSAILLALSGIESGELPPTALVDLVHSRSRTAAGRAAMACLTLDVCDDLLSKHATGSEPVRAALTAVANAPDPGLSATMEHASGLTHKGARAIVPENGTFDPQIEKSATQFLEAVVRDMPEAKATASCLQLTRGGERELQILGCIIYLMLDEARCVSEYPETGRRRFATLFGNLIEQDLMPRAQLTKALVTVLSSLNAPSTGRTPEALAAQDFGVVALNACRRRLHEWPKFASQVRAVQDIEMLLPGIVAFLDHPNADAASQQPAATQEQQPLTGARPVEFVVPGLHTHDIRSLMSQSTARAPSSVVQDRVNFLVSNTDPSNIETHAAELRALITPEVYEYFAEYLVTKRVALELNNHRMYLELLDKMQCAGLDRKVRQSTIRACKNLLASEGIRSTSNDRTLLKTLGAWLGLTTIARDIPILASELDFRVLIPRGIVEGKLIAIVAFIARVLQESARSRVFAVPNPWTMGLLAQLYEMYHLPDLKITLRFEVEVLCRNLGVQIDPLVIRRPLGLEALKAQHVDVTSSDFKPPADPSDLGDAPSLPPMRQLQPHAAPFQPRGPQPAMGDPSAMGVMGPVGVPHAMQPHFDLRASRELNELQLMPHMRDLCGRALLTAGTKAFAALTAQLEGPITTAAKTAKEIAIKDFLDNQFDALEAAARTMARSLASNLVAVSMRESVRELLFKALREAIPSIVTDDVVESVVRHNLTLALEAADLFVREQAPAAATMQLREFQAERAAPRHLAAFLSSYAPWRVKLSDAQVQVYYDFEALRGSLRTPREQLLQLLREIELESFSHYRLRPPPEYPGISLTDPQFTSMMVSEPHARICKLLPDMTALLNDHGPRAMAALVQTTMELIIHFSDATRRAGPNDAIAHHASHLAMEVCFFVLQHLRTKVPHAVPSAVSEVTRVFFDNERCWSLREVAANLTKLHMFDMAEFDRRLAEALRSSSPNEEVATRAMDFAKSYINTLIETKNPDPSDLKLTLHELTQIRDRRRPSSVRTPSMTQWEDPLRPREEVQALFREWVGICERRALEMTLSPEERHRMMLNFIQKLQVQGKLKTERGADAPPLERFFVALTEIIVEDYATQLLLLERDHPRPRDRFGEPRVSVNDAAVHAKLTASADAYSDLIVVLIKCCSWSGAPPGSQRGSQSPEVALVTKVLMYLARSLRHTHDYFVMDPAQRPQVPLPQGVVMQDSFQQQPYVRALSNIILQFAPVAPAAQGQDEAARETVLDFFCTIAQILATQLSPAQVPGFAFGWLELVCHRIFVARMLSSPRRGWEPFFKLLVCALTFLQPLSALPNPPPALRAFYRSVLKLFVLLIHDFQDFLLRYHQPLCNLLPVAWIQMRNVVLSAYPRALKLPDPFNDRLRLDRLKDMDAAPPVLDASRECFNGTAISRAALDHFMNKRKPDAAANEFLAELPAKLRDPATGRYNVPLLNDLIYYVGIVQAEARVAAVTAAANAKTPTAPPAFNVAETAAYELVSYLAARLNNEGRFMLVTACANQLRFPNSHTHLFALILITLISQAPDGVDPAEHEHIQEIICRVLLERIVVTRPQPWGLLVTIFEIIKNPRYDLQSKSFYRYSPQVQKFFDNISQKLNGPQRAEPQPQPQAPAGTGAAPQQPQQQQQLAAAQQLPPPQMAQPRHGVPMSR